MNVPYQQSALVVKITNNGIIVANKIRLVLAIVISGIIISAMSGNPPAINYTFITAILIFFIITLLIHHSLKKGSLSSKLLFCSVIIEVSLPSLMKLSHAFAGNPHLVINETIVTCFYYLLFLLSIIQNNSKLTIALGITVIAEYTVLLLLSIYYWNIPTAIGRQIPGYIMIDNEIVRIIIFFAFTAVSLIIIKNSNSFSSEADKNEKFALNRNMELEKIINDAEEMSRELSVINEKQMDIIDKFNDLSQNQAAMSEQLSSSNEELTSSSESINESMKNQKKEGERSEVLGDELSSTSEEVAKNTDFIVGSISSIIASSDETRESLYSMLERMKIISLGGDKIDRFITIINDINNRISLLSLNAAIEAARAGEHGKGFAVVADEIGKLSYGTADNSSEIAAQINAIKSDISEGIRIADITRIHTENTLASIDEINRHISEVQSAINRQGVTIDEVRHQSRVVSTTAGEIADSCDSQLTAMEENIKTIQLLACMSGEIKEYTNMIGNHSSMITDISEKLNSIVSLSKDS